MDFGFLRNIGSAIGHGAKAGFGAVKTGIGKLGEMGGDDDEDGGMSGFPMMKRPMPMTPGINPNASMPSLKASMMGGDSGLINRPRPMKNQMPQLMPPNAPSFEPIRDSVNINDRSPDGQIGVTDQQPQMIPLRAPGGMPLQPPAMVAQSFGQQNIPMVGRAPEGQIDRRQDVPIPQLPGHRGEPIPYNEMDAAKWDHVYGKMQHGADGHETGVKRSLRTSLANGVLAMNKSFQEAGGFRNPNAWQAALAGGAVGGIGSAIAPQAAQEVNFDWAHRPEIEDRQRRQQEDEDRGIMKRGKMADIEGVKARTAATIAGTKDVGLERQYRMAQIAKMEADAEAKRTGKPQKFMDYDPETGQFRNAFKYPDGHVEYEGQSGEARLKQEGYQNQAKMNTDRIEGGMARTVQQGKDAYKRTQAQQSGANWRTTQSQAGQNKRTSDRIDRKSVV